MDEATAELTELCSNEPLYTEEKESIVPSPETPVDKLQDTQTSKWPTLLGYTCASVLAVALAVSAGCAQCLGGSVPRYELNCVRYLVACVVSPPVIFYKRVNITPGWSRSHIISLCVFCCASCIYSLTFYEASIYLPIATLGGLENSLILIITAVIQLLFFVRKCVLQTMLSVLVCLVGIVLTTQPAFLVKMGSASLNSELHTRPLCVRVGHSDNISLWNNTSGINQTFSNVTSLPEPTVIANGFRGYLLVACSALMYIAVIFSVKYLKDMHTFALLFLKSIFSAVLSAFIMLAVEVPTLPRSPFCVGLLFSHSMSAGLADLSMLGAIVLLQPITFSVLTNLVLVGMLCSQYTVLRHVNPGHHNALEVVGVVLVLTACLLEPIFTLGKTWRQNKAA